MLFWFVLGGFSGSQLEKNIRILKSTGNSEMVFCYQYCSGLLWVKIVLVIEKKRLKFEAKGWEFAKKFRSLEQFVQTVKGQSNLWQQNAF